MKFSVQENLVPGKDYEEKFSLLKQLGYDGVELWGKEDLAQKVDQIKEASASYGISVSTICVGYKGDLLAASPKDRELAVNGIIDRLNWAAELGAVGVIVVPTAGGPKIPDLSPYATAVELERRLLIEELKLLSKKALDVGSRVIIEPVNRYESHLANKVADAYSIALEAGEGVAVMADFYHMNIEEANVIETLKSVFPRLVHLHLSDNNRSQPGKGHVDFAGPLSYLESLGYSYYGALECNLSGEPKASLKEEREFLRSASGV